jgi:hypothetical protein
VRVATLPRDVERSLLDLDRRGFLRLAAAAAAGGLLPLGCGGVPRELAPPPGLSLAVLSPRAYSVFQAAALRLVGDRGAARIRSRAIDPGARADAWLAGSPELADTLETALLALEFAPWPFLPKLSRFTALGPADQDRVLDDLRLSRSATRRALFRGVKSFVGLCFYSAAPARELVGYPGPFGGRTPEALLAAVTYEVER